jgi:DNA-directed RNA polymerase specialized sigma24 family protein
MITSNAARDPLARIGELMDSDHSSLVTVILDTQAVTYPARAVEDFVALHIATLLDWAGGAIRRHRVSDPAFGAADALQEALLMTLEAMKGGKVGSMDTEEDVVRLFRHKLAHAVLRERARADARKRGGSGSAGWRVSRAARDSDVDLDAIGSHTPPPEEQAIVTEEVERRLTLLDQHNPGLRAVAVKKAEGFTHEEIAGQLGGSLSTVERQVRRIKAILEMHVSDPGRRKFNDS